VEETRRERKKRQTRQLLVDTAVRLFAEQGYEQTTVAQIAAAADVATKTFFNYFPTKEDVLLTEGSERNAIALAVIADRRPGENVAELLTRAYEAMAEDYRTTTGTARDPALLETYARLLMNVPAVQARALHMMFEVQKEMAAALLAACPDELDPVSAAAVVGALAGATQGAALASLAHGEQEDRFWEAMRRGVDIALRGLSTS
jgi:AcrR family transcriptional regulator